MAGTTASVVGRALANLLRLADADLKDAELLSSGRHPGNAPALLQLVTERLVSAVLATEHGWPLADLRIDFSRIPSENPLRAAIANLAAAGGHRLPPTISDDGSLPTLPDGQELRANILTARTVLKNLAATFEVDLSGAGLAGKISPARLAVVPKANPEKKKAAVRPAPTSKPEQPTPVLVPLKPTRQRTAPQAAPPVKPPSNAGDALSRPIRFSVPKSVPAPVPERHEVEGRASIEVREGAASMASTPFWTLMDKWNIPDQAALDLIGHPGGLTKKNTRPRFKLVGEEAVLLRSFQEIDAALRPLGLEPKTWLHQPIAAAPFDGATPAAYLTSRRKQGVQDVQRFILQHGLRLSMSNSQGRTG